MGSEVIVNPNPAPLLAQAREPFRLAGSSRGAESGTTSWWPTAIDARSAITIAGAVALVLLLTYLALRIGRSLARARARDQAWAGIARAMSLNRRQRDCLQRLSAAAGISEPAALLITPSVFAAAFAAGAPTLADRDKRDLIDLAATRGWTIPTAPALPTRATTHASTLEVKPNPRATAAAKPPPRRENSQPTTQARTRPVRSIARGNAAAPRDRGLSP